MHIDLRDGQRQRLFAVDVDLRDPPAMVRSPEGGTTVALDWDRALDDERHLRHCPACGCPDLFVRKAVPQLTAFAVLLLAAVVAMTLLGIGQVAWAGVALVVILAVDVAIYLFARRELVCYRCHSEFSRLPIRRGHPRWESAVAEKYRDVPARPTATAAAGADGEPADAPVEVEVKDKGASPP